MDSPPINLQKTQRSNSMFHPTATTSDEEMIPKKFRRIRSRHHKTIRNSNNDLDILPSSQNYKTSSFAKPNSFPDEESNLPCLKSDISLNGHHQPSPPLLGYEKIQFRHAQRHVGRNESIWSYNSTSHRLLEDVEIIKELIFLRDIQLGFLPDDYELEFESCFHRLSIDERFAVRQKRIC